MASPRGFEPRFSDVLCAIAIAPRHILGPADALWKRSIHCKFRGRHAFGVAGRGDRVQTAANGEEAVAYLTGRGEKADRSRFPLPDVIITDLKMPHMNGLEFLGWLRADERWRNVPRIALTSSTATSDVATAYSLGASAYFVKPVDIHALRILAKVMSDFWIHAVSPQHLT